MRIGLDLLHALPEIGGGWNYIARLVKALGDFDRENDYSVFVTRHTACLVPASPNFTPVQVSINSVSRAQRVFYENTFLQAAARRRKVDVIHWFASTLPIWQALPSVVSVYDLLLFETPQVFPIIQRLYLRLMIPFTARNADVLLPISNTTAMGLNIRLGVAHTRMQVIPPVIEDSFQPAAHAGTIEFRHKHQLPEKFWLYVAHFYPHKNHVRLLQAFRELLENGFEPWALVLRGDDHGAGEDVHRTVSTLGLERHVRFLPSLSEAELPLLYSAATGMIFPSIYEGVGIPLLEAMACGCPVIGSRIPPVVEFGGDTVACFDPYDTHSIAEAVQSFQVNPSRQQETHTSSLKQIEAYRPQKVAEKLVKAYTWAINS